MAADGAEGIVIEADAADALVFALGRVGGVGVGIGTRIFAVAVVIGLIQ